MTESTARKLRNEINSLQGLSIINLMCSALALAFGVYFLMPTLIQMVQTQTFSVEQIAMAALGAVVFGLAFRWLISIAEILEVNSDLNTTLEEHKKEGTLTDDVITGLIVAMTAAYRENKPTLKRMVTISKIACAAFTLLASSQLISLAFTGAVGVQVWLSVLSAGICYGVAAACFIIPHFFNKYSAVWEQRLSQAAQAEAELKNLLGEAP